MLHAVIMAGGSGTRFWPESRDDRPKQLLRMDGERTMLQATFDRLRQFVPADRILIATNSKLASAVAEQLPELPAGAILGEPCKRDTAPCIGLAAVVLARRDPQAIMAVMPSDHVIGPTATFQEALAFAAQLVDEQPDRFVTFGIRPSYPAETFGYIERHERLHSNVADRSGAPTTWMVRRFREKPKVDVARQYLDSGGFYWNSGIFVWRAAAILKALREHQRVLYEQLERIGDAYAGPEFETVLRREFDAMRGISIDFAVMEHAQNVVVIEAPFEWDDVGSWQALARLRGTDEGGNTIIGRHQGVRTTGTIVRGPDDHLIVTLGIKDCVVVHTADATLVANKHDEESIREVVRLLKERGWDEYL